MRILLTGGHGHVAQEFIRVYGQAHEVTATTRDVQVQVNSNARYVVAPGVTELEGLFKSQKFDAIIHLAQSRKSGNDSLDGVSRTREHLAIDSIILEQVVKGVVSRLFLASTGGLYANSESPLRETDRLLEPPNLDVYYASKLAMEVLVSPYINRFDVTIGRFFFVYGPNQGPSRLMSRLIRSVSLGQPVRVSDSGGVKMNPIFVADAAQSIQQCLLHDGGRIINIAGPESTSIKELVDRIGVKLGKQPILEFGGDDRNLVADNSRLLAISSFGMVNLDEGLSRTVESESE
jgi:nucleoside-diphosphate-sugar epimerase